MSDDYHIRYSRQMALDEISISGQKRLKAASVIIIGAGGIGSPVAYYLAAAGVGKIGIADYDNVELSNLNRQIVHTAANTGMPKSESAAMTIRAFNPGIEIKTYNLKVAKDNIKELISSYDLIIDGVDNFEGKYLINDTCVALKKTFIHGGVLKFKGQVFVYQPGSGCLRCMIPDEPVNSGVSAGEYGGILGAFAGIIGSLQAAEAVKIIAGYGEPLVNTLLSVDGLSSSFKKIAFNKDPNCPVCKKQL